MKTKNIKKSKSGKSKSNNLTNNVSSLALPLYIIMPFVVAYISTSAILDYYNFYNMGISNEANTHYMYYTVFPILSIALFAISELVILALKKNSIRVGHDHRFAIGMILTIFLSVCYVWYSVDLVKNYPSNYVKHWSNIYRIWTGNPIIELDNN